MQRAGWRRPWVLSSELARAMVYACAALEGGCPGVAISISRNMGRRRVGTALARATLLTLLTLCGTCTAAPAQPPQPLPSEPPVRAASVVPLSQCARCVCVACVDWNV